MTFLRFYLYIQFQRIIEPKRVTISGGGGEGKQCPNVVMIYYLFSKRIRGFWDENIKYPDVRNQFVKVSSLYFGFLFRYCNSHKSVNVFYKLLERINILVYVHFTNVYFILYTTRYIYRLNVFEIMPARACVCAYYVILDP